MTSSNQKSSSVRNQLTIDVCKAVFCVFNGLTTRIAQVFMLVMNCYCVCVVNCGVLFCCFVCIIRAVDQEDLGCLAFVIYCIDV